MADPKVTGALISAQGRLRANLVAKLVALIVGMLTAYQRGPRSAADTASLVTRLAAALTAGDKTAARLGRGLVTSTFPTARTATPLLPTTWTQEQVERIVQEWLANPVPETVAQDVTEHVALAERDGTSSTQVRGVTGWRRVIHPELSEGGTCGLCVAATTKVYRTGKLKPIHEGCNCGVLPIVGENDPGDALNRLDLGDLYDDAGQTTDGWTLKQTRYQVNTHGQLEAVRTRQKRGKREPQAAISRRARQRRAYDAQQRKSKTS
ncbi:MAG: hypothetical protein HOQ30_04345 [Gemmatimonadaceae bacterium]|nr:hypothetical protein [Streptomycetaceae bacterium]NUR33219.1 hypothetical protein [Gemmatimonadaceae bacterium]